MIKLAEKIHPLMNLMQEDLLGSSVIHAAETEIQVLDEPHKKAQTKSYIWALGRRGAEPIIFFHYHPQRSTSAALQVLADYTGIIVADGYKVYESLERKLGFKLAACMAHIRRKFWEAEKVAKREIKKGTPILASEALALIKHLYAIEDEILDEPPDSHLIQDSFSAAHTVRNTDQAITEFCKFGTHAVPAICFHSSWDALAGHDYIWTSGLESSPQT